MPTAEVLREIRRAARPHGVATVGAFDLTARQIHRACDAGALDRPHPGVYVDPAVPWTPQKELAIAVAASGYLAAAWGRSAAALWGMVDAFPSTPEIVVPYKRRVAFPGAVTHRSRDLCWDHVTTRESIRTTNPLITVLDLGVVLGPMALAEIIIGARQRKLFEPHAVAATLTRLARPGRTGVRNVRGALELLTIRGRPADSVLELRFHRGPGQLLPDYEYQWPVTVEGKRFRIDFAYPEVLLAIEVDGYENRRSEKSLEDDNERQNRLERQGWRFQRFTWSRVLHDPEGVARDVLVTLRSLGYRFGR